MLARARISLFQLEKIFSHARRERRGSGGSTDAEGESLLTLCLSGVAGRDGTHTPNVGG